MRRRDFIILVGNGISAWPLDALTQQPGKIWRMGFIAQGYEKFYDALFEGLQALGYEEGRNLTVERRYPHGHTDRFAEFAAEMVRLKVDIIIVTTTPAALAVKNATTVLQDALTLQHRTEIIDFTVQKQLPGMFVAKEWVEAGGLMSYGESLSDMYQRGAYFVEKIFKGTRPADLPVEQVTKFELILNLKTAKAIGLVVPPLLLVRADQIIE
jgi:ABC-type uncharacterized transport system substrate-binding protein